MISTSRADLLDLWQRLELPRGRPVLCHSFLASLGRVEGGYETVIDSLLEHIGEAGTLVVPCFTYSFRRNEVFDVQQSPSTVGAFGDAVRLHPRGVRSKCPYLSMAAIGADAEFLMRRDSMHCIGKDTPYDKVTRAAGHILLIGVDFTALTLFMHLEKMHEVHYRVDMELEGVTRDEGREFADRVTHFAREETVCDPRMKRDRVGALLDQRPDCKHARFAYGAHRAIPALGVAAEVTNVLKRDPFFLIERPVPCPAHNIENPYDQR